jgi:DNA-directed RNA polymerase specialized sigma24 family protein
MPQPKNPRPEPVQLDAACSATAALLAAAREDADGAPRRKAEIILYDAGLSNEQIGQLVGKNAEAVRKAIARYRESK